MKRVVATVIAIAAFAVPAQALAAPTLAAPLPGARPAQTGTTTSTTTTTTTTSTTTTTPPTGTSRPGRPTINNFSDRKALNAYATYLSALINQQPVGQANDTSYIATISGTSGCKAALAPLMQPPYQMNTRAQHTLTVLGQEIGGDITINFNLSATQAFSKFSSVLRSLRWSRLSGGSAVIRRYVNAGSNLLALGVSNLCLDATNASLHPDTVPEDTRTFIETFDRAASQANLALTNLLALMQAYEMPGERWLVARISTLANELSTQTKAYLLQSGAALSTVLEASN